MKNESNNKVFLLLIDGPMGSGKTTVAKILHGRLKRTAYLGLDRVKSIISDFKRNPFDNEISRNVELAMTKEYLKQGINVIVEQGMTLRHIKAFKKIAKKYNANLFIYQLDAPKKLLTERVFERAKLKGKFKPSKARVERNYKIHLKNKDKGAVVFDTEKLSLQQIIKHILKELNKELK